MFDKILHVLRLVFVQFFDTQFARQLVVVAIVVPLIVLMYGYFDEVVLNAEQALDTIQNQSVNDIPLGSYLIAYMNVAQIDTCLTTILGYMATALVWSFTTDLKPMMVKK